MSRSARRGFTLIELLVVIAIIGVLIAISLPSFQGLRESSRRMECQVRLARIGEALMNYESAYGALPAGTINPSGPIHNRPTGTHTSWIVQILPYLGVRTPGRRRATPAATMTSKRRSPPTIGVYCFSTAMCDSTRSPTGADTRSCWERSRLTPATWVG
ncbi:MAG: DUF1559 domain-containing protein [Planctomycetia bacterium]|nr:DUF1559 domain-containing protein [Planctomycetia bacterium]